jgi:hypothetical protein
LLADVIVRYKSIVLDIRVEKVSVRNEGNMSLVPANPAFRFGHASKNVITVVKRYQYWLEYRSKLLVSERKLATAKGR